MPTSQKASQGSKFPPCSRLLCGAKTTTAQIREDQKRCPVEQVPLGNQTLGMRGAAAFTRRLTRPFLLCLSFFVRRDPYVLPGCGIETSGRLGFGGLPQWLEAKHTDEANMAMTLIFSSLPPGTQFPLGANMLCDEFVWPSEMLVGDRSAGGRSNGQPDCVAGARIPSQSAHIISSAPGPTRSIRWVQQGSNS